MYNKSFLRTPQTARVRRITRTIKNITYLNMETNPLEYPYGVYITIFLNGTIKFELDKHEFDLGENLSIRFVENTLTFSEYTEITYDGSVMSG